jgi:hypothetical protein
VPDFKKPKRRVRPNWYSGSLQWYGWGYVVQLSEPLFDAYWRIREQRTQKNAVILVEYAPIELQARKLMGALANGTSRLNRNVQEWHSKQCRPVRLNTAPRQVRTPYQPSDPTTHHFIGVGYPEGASEVLS